jgi:uncharacterized membrane protein YhaH (DUF805 family)
MNWYVAVLKNYVGFSGRARRQEFWMFVLINFIIGAVLGALARVSVAFYIIEGIYELAILLPSLAVAFRRLHDTGRTAWWILIGLIPLIGWIVLLVFYCTEGDSGANKYGPDPKDAVTV